jgi:ABC-type Zn uptake system ZnuABC Zn-binding protein ZnuA
MALGSVSCKRGSSGKPRVAVSIFPLYDVARRVAGDRLEVVLVLPPGRSEHSYDPTPREMARVADSRLAISVGLGMDEWLTRIVQGAAGTNVTMLEIGPRLDPRPTPLGAVGEEAADEARNGAEDDDHHGPQDPHVWLDPQRMSRAVDLFVDAFTRLDAPGAAGFRTRGDEVKRSLGSLDQAIEARAHSWSRHSIVTFHGSMGYYAARYGLQIAAVVEPFPGREPTPRYMADVLGALQRLHPAAMFSEPQLDRRPAQVIADQSHVPLFEVDPVGGTPGADTYERLLTHNTDVFEQALR